MQTLTDVKTMETEAGFNESTTSNTKTNIDDTSPPLTMTPITTITKAALPAWAKPVPRSSLMLARMSAIAETAAAPTTTTTTVITATTEETATNLLITRSSSPTIWARPHPVCSSGNMLRSVTLTNHSSTKFATSSGKPVALLKNKTIPPSYTDCQIGTARNLTTPTTSITSLSSQPLPSVLTKNAAIITTASHCSRALDSTTTASSTRPQTSVGAYATWIGSSMHSGITTTTTSVNMPTVTSIPLVKTTAIVTGSSILSNIMKTSPTTLITTSTARGANRNFSNTTSSPSTTSTAASSATTITTNTTNFKTEQNLN